MHSPSSAVGWTQPTYNYFKGNSAQGGTKPAIIEGGATVNVPMFIEQGTKIIVSTADLKYMGKAEGVNRN